jgi:hypothetical protein
LILGSPIPITSPTPTTIFQQLVISKDPLHSLHTHIQAQISWQQCPTITQLQYKFPYVPSQIFTSTLQCTNHVTGFISPAPTPSPPLCMQRQSTNPLHLIYLCPPPCHLLLECGVTQHAP